MKILHVIPSLASEYGGPSTVVRETCRALISCGEEVRIVTTSLGSPNATADALPVDCHWHGIPVTTIPVDRHLYGMCFYAPALRVWLRQNIRSFDVLDLHYLFASSTSVAARCARRSEVPYTVRLMGQLEPWARNRHWFRKQIYLHTIDRNLFRWASAVQCSSLAEFKNAQHLGIPNLVKVPLGIDTDYVSLPGADVKLREKLGLAASSQILLFLSRMDAKKRFDKAVELLSELESRGDIYLAVAGTGAPQYVAQMQSLVKAKGLSERVLFLGHVEGEMKELLLQGSSLLVLLSESENFGCVVPEALVRGLPVIASSNVGASEMMLGERFTDMVISRGVSVAEPATRLLAGICTSTFQRKELAEESKRIFGWKEGIEGVRECYRRCMRRGISA